MKNKSIEGDECTPSLILVCLFKLNPDPVFATDLLVAGFCLSPAAAMGRFLTVAIDSACAKAAFVNWQNSPSSRRSPSILQQATQLNAFYMCTVHGAWYSA